MATSDSGAAPSAGFWALPAPAVLAILGPTCGAVFGLVVLPLITALASARTGNSYSDLVQLSLWFAVIEVAVGFLAGGLATAVGLLVRWPFARRGTVVRVVAGSIGAGGAAFVAGWAIESAFQGYFGSAIGAGVLSAFVAGSIVALLEWACAAGRARYRRRLDARAAPSRDARRAASMMES